jgi:hypothetical protein
LVQQAPQPIRDAGSIIEQVAFETEVEDEIVVAPAVLAPALPTTG